MKTYWNKAAWIVIATPMLFTACKKDDNGALDGPLPQPTFTTTSKQVGLATRVYFKNTTQYSGPGIVQYEWDFGDGTTVKASSDTISHVYTKGGTVQPQLLASARGGNGFSPKQNVVLPDVMTLVKQLLTGNTSKTWTLDNTAAGTVTVGPNDSDVKSYYAGGPVGSLPGCQADDEYTFSNANMLTYDAKGQTFVAGGACDTPRNYTTSFTYGAAVGSGIAQIDIQSTATGTARPFIGVTDAPDFTYRIMSIDANHMVLRAGKSTASPVFELKLTAK